MAMSEEEYEDYLKRIERILEDDINIDIELYDEIFDYKSNKQK